MYDLADRSVCRCALQGAVPLRTASLSSELSAWTDQIRSENRLAAGSCLLSPPPAAAHHSWWLHGQRAGLPNSLCSTAAGQHALTLVLKLNRKQGVPGRISLTRPQWPDDMPKRPLRHSSSEALLQPKITPAGGPGLRGTLRPEAAIPADPLLEGGEAGWALAHCKSREGGSAGGAPKRTRSPQQSCGLCCQACCHSIDPVLLCEAGHTRLVQIAPATAPGSRKPRHRSCESPEGSR